MQRCQYHKRQNRGVSFAPDETSSALHYTVEILDGRVFTGEEASPDELQEMAAQVEDDMRNYIEETGSILMPFMEITSELAGDTLSFHDEESPTIWT